MKPVNTVTYIPLHVAESFYSPRNMICLLEKGRVPLYSARHLNYLRINVDDIEDYVDSSYDLFDHRHAQRIISFCEALGKGQHLFVHCEAGISRSAAVAKFLCDKMGFIHVPHNPSLFNFDGYNGHIYGVLCNAKAGKLYYDDRADGIFMGKVNQNFADIK
ncbi:hypothetical protein RVBP18_2400 [Pseudomonas phage sp. LC]|nr:hypothetical protein RVBP18_2400 [Pseudomonas phage sp. LC]